MYKSRTGLVESLSRQFRIGLLVGKSTFKSLDSSDSNHRLPPYQNTNMQTSHNANKALVTLLRG